MSSLSIMVISNPAAPYLRGLDNLPAGTEVVIGNTPEAFASLGDRADVVLYCMNAGVKLEALWPLAPKARWLHSMAAGLESTLFPALVESPIPMTNARGVFKESLGEFGIASILYFAKDLRRMIRNQEAARWEQFDVEMITGKTLGIVGYGEIGRATAVRAKALGLNIHAIRRRPELSGSDPVVDRSFAIADRAEMLAGCDYVLLAAPLTEETRGLVGPAELAAMKPSAVLINLGRGPVVDEAALIAALSSGQIRGAALDVFDVEPLPAGHPFWTMENVLISPHCADHTATWTDEAIQFFVDNCHRFLKGEPLENLVNKKLGY
jgi:phosphoglycerate dehydrogenase-like enzyme